MFWCVNNKWFHYTEMSIKQCKKETAERKKNTSIKDEAQQENLHNLAITDYCRRENLVMDLDNARVMK